MGPNKTAGGTKTLIILAIVFCIAIFGLYKTVESQGNKCMQNPSEWLMNRLVVGVDQYECSCSVGDKYSSERVFFNKTSFWRETDEESFSPFIIN